MYHSARVTTAIGTFGKKWIQVGCGGPRFPILLQTTGVLLLTPPLTDQIREFEKGVFNIFQNRPNLKRLLLFFSENLEDFASLLTPF